MGITEAVQTRPTARIDVIAASEEDQQCSSDGCTVDADLKITFIGQLTAPNYRCMEHWSGARSVLTDAGYSIEYAPKALDWIMRR